MLQKNIRMTWLLLVLLNFSTKNFSQQLKRDSSLVNQEIRFSSKGAAEVFLVWGINNWNLQSADLRPFRTFIKGGLMYTPMKFQKGFFSIQLKLKPNTMVDYVFWIAKGPRNKLTDVWDINKYPRKDYHTLAISDNIAIIESEVQVRSKEPLTLLDFSWIFFGSVSFLFVLVMLIKKYKYNDISIKAGPQKIILTGGLVLISALFLIRPSLTGISWDIYYTPLKFIPQLIWTGFYDVLYVVCLVVLFLLLIGAFRNYRLLQFVAVCFFIASALLSLLAAILNIRIVQALGKNFTYQWLYYSDFLNSADSKAALTSNLSSAYIIDIIMVCVSVIIATLLLISLMNLFIKKHRFKNGIKLVLLCFVSGYFFFAHKKLENEKWNYEKLANPVTVFLKSANPFAKKPQLFTMEVADSLRSPQDNRKNLPADPIEFSKKIKNVIVFVMESTPAEYIQLYKSKYSVTPEIVKYDSNSIIFENVYAHAPATNNSMVSLLGSVYPWISFNSITKEHPDINIPTISSELKTHGYRTSFFSSADNRFQRAGEFLAKRGFDYIEDCRSHANYRKKYEVNEKTWSFPNGRDDEGTGEELISWINKEPGKPFFSVIWTYQTHYPYFFSEKEEKYDDSDPVFNRYLNAVKHSDLVLGNLLSELKRKGLFESTLVVVIGDHGEAFGRHDQTTHASKIYEENLHIPCVFINPSFKKIRYEGNGGLVDIAPTLMNILNLPIPENWQGKNLFASTKNDRVYFFAPWSDYLFGYREGDLKYIFNATMNATEIYDLLKDPHETKNLAGLYPEKVELCHQYLAAWVQYQNKFKNLR